MLWNIVSINFKWGPSVLFPAGGGCVSTPISTGGVNDLRRLILRTLNDNQLLILTSVASQRRSLTSLLKDLSETRGIPLSTLKLNARILRELNLISYGSTREKKTAEVKKLLSHFVYNYGTCKSTLLVWV